ncbi:unnamed protein product [Prorocentrum cordatum]|uniref:Uncharacterized protein n=1 Tax=Prorocentrum cordatum TaxID=2364126 RepID=A0ABN9W8B7_9DINO|nr:unnamed protein product [Polarella glacialis]
MGASALWAAAVASSLSASAALTLRSGDAGLPKFLAVTGYWRLTGNDSDQGHLRTGPGGYMKQMQYSCTLNTPMVFYGDAFGIENMLAARGDAQPPALGATEVNFSSFEPCASHGDMMRQNPTFWRGRIPATAPPSPWAACGTGRSACCPAPHASIPTTTSMHGLTLACTPRALPGTSSEATTESRGRIRRSLRCCRWTRFPLATPTSTANSIGMSPSRSGTALRPPRSSSLAASFQRLRSCSTGSSRIRVHRVLGAQGQGIH